MRRHRIGFVGALALALALPGIAMGAGVQGIEAGFSPKADADVVPGQSVVMDDKQFSKKGTLYTRVFLDDVTPPVPSADHVDIDYPAEGKISTKRIPRCDPADIQGSNPQDAIAACKKAQVGQGSATAFGVPAGPVSAFNGPKQGGNPTILLHSFTANVPIVLQGVISPSPVGPQYGQRLSVPVSTSAGGGVPPGIAITDFDTTVSKLTKVKKKKKKKKKFTYVSARCTDGVAEFQGTFEYSNFPTQTVQTTQPCTQK